MEVLNKFTFLDSNKKKILSNVFWAMTGKIVNMLSALFVGILIARYLGPEQYGVMNYVISYVTLFSVLATFGLSNIEVRELAKSPENKNAILGTCFRLRFLFTTVAYILIVVTLVVFKTDIFTTTMILLYGLTLYTQYCFEVIRNYFTSIVKNEYIVKTEIARTLIGAGIKIVLLLIKAPLWCFIVAVIFDTILVASGYTLSYKKIVGKINEWFYDKTLTPYLVKQSFPLVLSGAAVIIYQRIDQVMIGNMLSKTEVGYFATAGKFVDLILFLPMVLVQTVTPLLVRAKEQDVTIYENKKRTFVSVTTWTAIFMSLVVSLFAYWLIKYSYGEKYILAVPVLQVMSFKAVGMALFSSGGQLIIIERLQKWAFIKNLLGCVLCIILNYLLIPRYGILGSAWVTIITVLFTGCLANFLIPAYHNVMKVQLYALFCGWKELFFLKKMIKK